MNWEEVIKATPYELEEFIEASEKNLLAFKDRMDYFYSRQSDAGLIKLLKEADKHYESINSIFFDIQMFLDDLKENRKEMQERLQ
jgi:hypothetical protein|tara:strand:- start:288 stop:542 length:255 start_codon:yes stop_codon:yes gene_type:complete